MKLTREDVLNALRPPPPPEPDFNRGDPGAPIVLLVALMVLIALLIVGASAQLFGGEPTDAVVRVIGQRGAGSGTVVSPAGHVLTCHHVMEVDLAGGNRQARIEWRSGGSVTSTVIAFNARLDLCLLEPSTPIEVDFVEVAGEGEWPKAGATIELAGYGGGNWRHWTGTVNGYTTHNSRAADNLSIATRSISGDSGGAMLYRGKLVGVLWGGPLAGHNGPMIATHGTCCEAIRPFLAQGCPSCFPGSGCQGGFCPVPSEYQPAPSPVQKPPAQRPREPLFPRINPQPPAPSPQPQGADAQIIAALEQRIAALEKRAPVPGPPGPPGKDGRDGKDGAAGASASPQPPAPSPAAARHFVVVGDPEARYARRLASEVAKTRQYFDAIDLVAPPDDKNVGTLPALVLYVGGMEAVTYRGTADVYLQLSRIRRGEFN